jgi:hypothetical protein
MRKIKRALALALLQTLLLQPPAYGWGDEGHTLINRFAAQSLPPEMPAFLRLAEGRLAYLGPEPDRWRAADAILKTAQEPDHFINLERIAELTQLPPTRYDFYRYLYARRAAATHRADDYLPEKVGMQPYVTMEIYERLKVAFREYRRRQAEGKSSSMAEQNAVFYAGWLGHYVADGANPLHTTIHYNGWVGENPRGYSTSNNLHWKFEGTFVERNREQLQFSGLVGRPVRLQKPFNDYMAFLRDSAAQVRPLYEIEKQGGFENQGSPAAREFLRRRLAAGSQMLLNFWYTAWMESGTTGGN